MTPEGRIVSFTVDQPFDAALRKLRKALAMEGLRVPCELDAAARLHQELGVGLRNNIVLYVDDPIRLLEAAVLNPSGVLFVPEPVALSSLDERSCRIAVRSMEPLFTSDLPANLKRAVAALHERILSAIERIGQRQTTATEIFGPATAPA